MPSQEAFVNEGIHGVEERDEVTCAAAEIQIIERDIEEQEKDREKDKLLDHPARKNLIERVEQDLQRPAIN